MSNSTWAADNPDKIKAIKHRFNIKHRDEISEYNLEYRKRKPWKSLVLAAKRRSEKYSLEFTISDEWAESKWTGICEITDVPFHIKDSPDGGAGSLSPSIDRINNEKGYTPDNCRFILWCVNRFKGQMTDDNMKDMVKILYDKLH